MPQKKFESSGESRNLPQLEIRGVTKIYPGVVALDDVSLQVSQGEIHAIIGENGAGKSTLMHIIAGVQRQDGGAMFIQGRPYAPASECEAQAAGVAIVFQEGSLFEPLSIAENVFAGRQPVNAMGVVDFERMNRETAQLLKDLELTVTPMDLVSSLSPGQKQLVEIAKALSQHVKVLILDEPTSSLTISEARHLFKVVRNLADNGVAVLFVTHRLSEIFELAHRATVLKDGRVSGEAVIGETTQKEIIHMQVGRQLTFERDNRRVGGSAKVVLEVEHLTASPVEDVSFQVRAGEIVCLAGLVGAGRTELCEALFGDRKISSGSIKVNGVQFRPRHPIDAIRMGIGMVPEDRREAGLFLTMSIAQNIVAANMGDVCRRGVILANKIKELAAALCSKLRVASPDIEREVMYLSGGNQQKVLFAKWLAIKPALFIVDEPTRGVDVGAKSDMYAIIRELAETGAAVLVVSSDLPEVLSVSHRIIVMSEGKIRGEMDAAQAQEFSILQMAMPAGVA